VRTPHFDAFIQSPSPHSGCWVPRLFEGAIAAVAALRLKSNGAVTTKQNAQAAVGREIETPVLFVRLFWLGPFAAAADEFSVPKPFPRDGAPPGRPAFYQLITTYRSLCVVLRLAQKM